MSEQKLKSYVDKLAFLELKTGHKVHYRVMPPITEPFRDTLAMQSVGRQIAEFIGLTDFTFVIAVAQQKDNIGGHIDLSTRGKEVFVEVASDMMKFPDAVAATLCHEACHKWLQVNGLESPIKSDNEILTDITSIFLGFGKIMLNGCSTANELYENAGINTETMKVGYLDRDHLAFVYRMVCAMRKIAAWDYMNGLNRGALSVVHGCDLSHGHLYEQNFHRPDIALDAITNLKEQMVEVQRSFADLNKYLTYTKKSFCETIDDFLSTGHITLDTFNKKTVPLNDEPDPALCFLRAIQSNFEVKQMVTEVNTLNNEAYGLLQHAKTLCSLLNQFSLKFPTPSPEMFNIVTCPKDGTKLRLPENSGDIIATCPTCKYRFAYNTNTLEFSESQSWFEKMRKKITK